MQWDMRRVFMICLAVTASSGPAAAANVLFGPDLAVNGWRLMTFPGLPPARFSALGRSILRVEANHAVAVLWRPIATDSASASSAHWRWRIDTSVQPTDLTKKGSDDRPLAVYFVFARGSLSSRPINLIEILRNDRAQILMYVWGGTAPKGTLLQSPHLGHNARIIVLRAGDAPLAEWISENVNLKADHQKAFGLPPGRLTAVAISSDSDDTSGRNVGFVADLFLEIDAPPGIK